LKDAVPQGTQHGPLTDLTNAVAGDRQFGRTRKSLALLALCFTGAFLAVGALRARPLEGVGPTSEAGASASPAQVASVWQVPLAAQESDFLEVLSDDRILVGTLETAGFGWGLKAKTIIMLNSRTGTTVWSWSRESLGDPQTLLTTLPVILIEGSKKYSALNPTNGGIVWERPRGSAESLLSPDGEKILLISRKATEISLTVVTLKDGRDLWSATIQMPPTMKDAQLEKKWFGDSVLLVGPDVAALSATTGQVLWQKPFPGNFGKEAAAIPLGSDLYFIDGSTMVRMEAASGSPLWRHGLGAGKAKAVAANDNSIFVLSRQGAGEDSPDSITALTRVAGERLWAYDFSEHVQSAMTVEGGTIYVTTPTTLVALDLLTGKPVFQTTFPPPMQATRLLPDIVRVAEDRIVVARETGVMAVQKLGGQLLFGEAVTDGLLYSNDDIFNMWTNAFLSVTKTAERSPLAFRFMNDQMAQLNHSIQLNQDFLQRAGLLSPEKRWQQERTQANLNLAYAVVIGLGKVILAVMDEEIAESKHSIKDAEVRQTYLTHAQSLQGSLYLRPCYRAGSGWFLALVNVKTGERTEVLMSPDNIHLRRYAPNLPAVAIDPAGSRLVFKGLSCNPGNPATYTKAVYRSTRKTVTVPFPCIVACDVGALQFAPVQRRDAGSPRRNPLKEGDPNSQLLKAAFQCDVTPLKAALLSGADVNTTDAYGRTALMLAAESLRLCNKKDMIALLLENGADVSITDRRGWTAVDHFYIVSWEAGSLSLSGQKGLHLLIDAEKSASKGTPCPGGPFISTL
jgi:outer membrane protein assembly factor BamB